MSDLIFTLNIVLPIVAIICIGFLFRKINLISEETLHNLDKICFKVFLPISLFNNVYSADNFNVDWKFALWISALLIIVFGLGLIGVKKFIKDDKQKGVVLQGLFRSNYAIIGISLASSIVGYPGAALASVIAIITIPINNVLAIIALTIFVRDENQEKPRVSQIIGKIFKNPLIIGVLAGVVVLLMRLAYLKTGLEYDSFYVNVLDNYVIRKTLSTLGNLATPLALLTLGGLFKFSYVKDLAKPLFGTVIIRMIIIPLIVFGITIPFFDFGAAEYAVMIAIFSSPVAISSAIMAKEMNNDAGLANQIVVWTTICSAFTVSFTIFLFRIINIF